MILITGCAGFIGFHVVNFFLDAGVKIIGIDNINDYYDVKHKYQRLKILNKRKNFKFFKLDLKKKNSFNKLFSRTGRCKILIKKSSFLY